MNFVTSAVVRRAPGARIIIYMHVLSLAVIMASDGILPVYFPCSSVFPKSPFFIDGSIRVIKVVWLYIISSIQFIIMADIEGDLFYNLRFDRSARHMHVNCAIVVFLSLFLFCYISIRYARVYVFDQVVAENRLWIFALADTRLAIIVNCFNGVYQRGYFQFPRRLWHLYASRGLAYKCHARAIAYTYI